MKRTSKAVESLQEIVNAIEAGDLLKLGSSLTINLQEATKRDLHALLEILRYKSFGHQLAGKDSEVSDIHQMRDLLNKGDFDSAMELSEKLSTQNPVAIVEKARALIFSGHYEKVPQLLYGVVKTPSSSLNNRGVAAQLIGHAHLEMGEYEMAEFYLKTAIEYATVSGNLHGRVAAHLFLSRLEMLKGNHAESDRWLTEAQRDIKSGVESFRWHLAYYRQKSLLYLFKKNTKCFQYAWMAILCSLALGDKVFESRGYLDLLLMAKLFCQDTALIMEKLRSPSIRRQLDNGSIELNAWRALAFDENSSFQTSTMLKVKTLLEQPVVSDKTNVNEVFSQYHWAYDTTTETLYDFQDFKVIPLKLMSRAAQIAKVLNESPSGLEIGKIFELIWQLKYSPHLHLNLVEVTCSGINQICTALKIVRYQQKLSLMAKGLILK